MSNNNYEEPLNNNENEIDISSYTNVEKPKEADFYKYNKEELKKKLKNEKSRLKYLSKQNRRFFNFMWVVMVMIISLVVAQFIVGTVGDALSINRTIENTVEISIPKGSSNVDVANILQASGVIKNASCFTGYMSLFRNSVTFNKGDYKINTNLEYEEIISYLLTQSNRTDIVDVTFSEGLTVLECADLLEEKGVCDKNDFLQKCNSSEFDEDYEFLAALKNTGKYYYKLEGYLYPDTYKFYQDSDAVAVIDTMLTNFENKIFEKTQTVAGYSGKVSIEQLSKDKGLSVKNLITLASMVQAEASDVKDMRIIAAIFLNRLNVGASEGLMWLNSDPTMYYPYSSKKDCPKGFVSTYNTYKHKGLPVGAISNPGMDAIDAVLNHEITNYRYFCHDSDGNAYYAYSEIEHINNLYKAGLVS